LPTWSPAASRTGSPRMREMKTEVALEGATAPSSRSEV
jgi:hypothetical protein